MIVRERPTGGLGAASILDTLGLSQSIQQFQQSLQVTQNQVGDMADAVTSSMPLVNVTLVVATVALGSMAIFAFLDFMDMNPFKRLK